MSIRVHPRLLPPAIAANVSRHLRLANVQMKSPRLARPYLHIKLPITTRIHALQRPSRPLDNLAEECRRP